MLPTTRQVRAGGRWLLLVVATLLSMLAVSGTVNAATDEDWDRLAKCEAGGNWATNTGNGFSGGLQFQQSTWDTYGGQEFAPVAYMATKDQQKVVAERTLAGQGWGAWPACSTSLGLNSPATLREAPSEPFVEASDYTPEPEPAPAAEAPAPVEAPAPAPEVVPAAHVGPMLPVNGTITARVGNNTGPHAGTGHNGTDIAAPIGTPFVTPQGGTVISAGPASGYGNWIRIQNDDATTSTFGHMYDYGVHVNVGQRVEPGQVIGEVGNAGHSTGAHLHWQVEDANGAIIDPLAGGTLPAPTIVEYTPAPATLASAPHEPATPLAVEVVEEVATQLPEPVKEVFNEQIAPAIEPLIVPAPAIQEAPAWTPPAPVQEWVNNAPAPVQDFVQQHIVPAVEQWTAPAPAVDTYVAPAAPAPVMDIVTQVAPDLAPAVNDAVGQINNALAGFGLPGIG